MVKNNKLVSIFCMSLFLIGIASPRRCENLKKALPPFEAAIPQTLNVQGKLTNSKIYKDRTNVYIDMFPSDPSGSLDDFFLGGYNG